MTPVRSTPPLVVALAALVAVVAMACSSTSSGTPVPSTPAASATASASPATASTPAATDAPALSASPAPQATPASSSDPAASASPSPAEQALMARFPKQVGDVALDTSSAMLATLAANSPGSRSFVEFANAIGSDPSKTYLAYAFPADPKAYQAAHGKAQWIYGAYQFVGADEKLLPEAFVKSAIATQSGATTAQKVVAGREVTELTPGTSASQGTSAVYLVFEGDTVFFGASSDPKLTEQIVASFPK